MLDLLRFCGWVDVGLSPLGHEEALRAAEAIAASRISINIAYTSLLKRANTTLETICQQAKLNLNHNQIIKDWRLNERHYGSLTGLNKAQCVQEYGAEQVQVLKKYSITLLINLSTIRSGGDHSLCLHHQWLITIHFSKPYQARLITKIEVL